MSHEGSPSRKRLQKQGDGFRCMASGMVHSLGRESPISPWIVGGEVVAFPTLEPPLSLQGRDWQLCTRKGIQGPWQRPGAGFSLCPGTFLGELGFLGKLWTHFGGDFRLAQEAGDTRPGICGFCRRGQGQERGSHLGSRILPLARVFRLEASLLHCLAHALDSSLATFVLCPWPWTPVLAELEDPSTE